MLMSRRQSHLSLHKREGRVRVRVRVNPSAQLYPLPLSKERAGRNRADSTKLMRALAVSMGLSILFLVVYGGCNWITARRGNVGVFYFQWERAIPFVPFLVLPYMSI